MGNTEDLSISKEEMKRAVDAEFPKLQDLRKLTKKPESATEWILEGDILFNEQDFLGAINNYDKAIKIAPKNTEAWHKKGICFLNTNQPWEALRVFDRIMLINSDFVFDKKYSSAFGIQTIALLKMKNYMGAITAAEIAKKIDPDFVIPQQLTEAWNNIGLSHVQRKEYAKAFYACEKAFAIDPTFRLNPRYSEAWDKSGNSIPGKPALETLFRSTFGTKDAKHVSQTDKIIQKRATDTSIIDIGNRNSTLTNASIHQESDRHAPGTRLLADHYRYGLQIDSNNPVDPTQNPKNQDKRYENWEKSKEREKQIKPFSESGSVNVAQQSSAVGKSWHPNEDFNLVLAFEENYCLKDLAKKFGRTESEIVTRLLENYLIENPEEYIEQDQKRNKNLPLKAPASNGLNSQQEVTKCESDTTTPHSTKVKHGTESLHSPSINHANEGKPDSFGEVLRKTYGLRCFWHFLRPDNLDSILKHGILSRNGCIEKGIPIADISDPGIQEHRKKYHRFAPLFFAPCPPMIFRINRENNGHIIALGISTRIMDDKPTLFSDGNVRVKHSKNFTTIQDLEKLNWQLIHMSPSECAALGKAQTSDQKRLHSAEVLVEDVIPPEYIESVSVRTEQMYNYVTEILHKNNRNIKITISLEDGGVDILKNIYQR